MPKNTFSDPITDQEAHLSRPAVEGLRKLNLGRDQILNRLWELATLSHEVTRGAITGQIKALSMIIAIEGLIPDRRVSPSVAQPAAQRSRRHLRRHSGQRKLPQAVLLPGQALP